MRTIEQEIALWRKRADTANLDGAAMLAFGISAGLNMARERYLTRSSDMAKKATKGAKKVGKVMHEWKEGSLHSGSKKGPVVKSQKQAVAIALSEGRKASKGRKKK